MAVVLSAVACLDAARRNRLAEALPWGVAVFLIPVQHDVWDLLTPDFSEPLILRRCLLVIGLGALLALAGWQGARSGRRAWIVWGIALVTPFLAIPHLGQVVTERDMHSAELDELSAWAAEATPKDTVFLFPDVGKGRQPGIFRVKARRAIYVDWKSGGQVNMVLDFAGEWWRRYEAALLEPFTPDRIDEYWELGVDYLVLQSSNRLAGREAVYENPGYAVYRRTTDANPGTLHEPSAAARRAATLPGRGPG